MASSGSGRDGDDNSNRYPPSLNGLLKFCIESTKDEDSTGPTQLAPMSDEKRQFLSDAMRSLQEADPIKVMLQDIQVVLSSAETDEDKEGKEASLENLQVHCEDMDLANDFHKIGGYALLKPLLMNEESGYRWRTADLIATLAQNNPYSQSALLEDDLMFVLTSIIETDKNNVCRIKSLYAISCITRDYAAGQDMFINRADGFSVLVRAMQSEEEKLQIKSSFMLASLCRERPDYKSTLMDMGLLDQLIALLHRPHSGYHEHLMRALMVLSEDNTRAQQEFRRPELGLRPLLEGRIQLLQGKEEYLDELEYAKTLHRLCCQSSTSEVER